MPNETATLAGGCFWCTEAIFRRLKGITSVIPGYSGGTVENPSYQEVSSGTTGHAESVQIVFDPTVLPYAKLLEVFMSLHDPTTLNKQGNDEGPQYRSAIFYHSEKQKKTAEELKEKLEREKVYPKPIVTEITPYTNFYPADDSHKEYYEKHTGSLYCQLVIGPKITKLFKEYRNLVKEGTE